MVQHLLRVHMFRSMTQWGWLDNSAVVRIVWSFWCKSVEPDIILNECVVGFQPDVVSETLTYQPAVGHMLGFREPPYAFDTITSCPTDFGVPCLWRRRWSRWMKGHGRGVLPGHALAPPAGHAPVNGGSAPVNGGGAPSDAPANGGSAPSDCPDDGRAPPTGSGPVDFSREHLTSLFARSIVLH